MKTALVGVAAALGALAIFGSAGIADADTGRETEACQLMDDYGGADAGYTPAQYAFMLLRAEPVGDSMAAPTSALDAVHVMAAATRDYCPRHTADLPRRWLGTSTSASPPTTNAFGALTLAAAIGQIKGSLARIGSDKSTADGWLEIIGNLNKYLELNRTSDAVNYLHYFTGAGRATPVLVDSVAQGIVGTPAQVQIAMDSLGPHSQ